MDQRISLITLAVADLERATAFYKALGWKQADSPDGVVAFDLIGQTLGLYPRAALAADMDLEEYDITGFSGITLSHNLAAKEDVAPLYQAALKAGARAIKPPHDIFWGGHIAYFADPDGHVWEIAHNPFSALGPNGEFQWNGA
ncbi:MAG: VOC family protein [Rhodobacter sp.]|nr:VOC family protein [Rhodobacter sp.]